MNGKRLKFFVPGLLAAAALALTVSVGAQTPTPSDPAPAVKAPQSAPKAGRGMGRARAARHEGEPNAECQAMMARKQEMQDKLVAMDATLDDLVAKMNAAGASGRADAMEQPMAAVINELVAQRKTMRSMKMEMQPAMRNQKMRDMSMRDTRGMIDCPMMKMDDADEAKTGNKPAGN